MAELWQSISKVHEHDFQKTRVVYLKTYGGICSGKCMIHYTLKHKGFGYCRYIFLFSFNYKTIVTLLNYVDIDCIDCFGRTYFWERKYFVGAKIYFWTKIFVCAKIFAGVQNIV